MTKKFRLKRSDELKILQIKLENTTFLINRAKGDLEQAQRTLTYVMEKLQKLINRYEYKPKAKTVNLQTKEAEKT